MRIISDEQWNLIPDEIKLLISPQHEQVANKKIVPQVFPVVKDIHFLLGTAVEESDCELFFGSKFGIYIPEGTDIFHLLVLAGCFTSKNEARKNWRGVQKLEPGYSEIGPVGKSKTMLYILNVH